MRRKTTEQHLRDGDRSHKGIAALKERLKTKPRAPEGLPRCPKHFGGPYRATWRAVIANLEAMDMVTLAVAR